MATLSIFNFISLNGFFKDAANGISWHQHGGPQETEFSSNNAQGGNMLLFGRKTYEMMAAFWPTPAAAESMPGVAAGMNAAEKQEIATIIARLNRELDLTVVLIEHDIGIVLKLAHHVVVLDYGRKLADGPPETIRENPDVIAAYLGSEHAEAAA